MNKECVNSIQCDPWKFIPTLVKKQQLQRQQQQRGQDCILSCPVPLVDRVYLILCSSHVCLPTHTHAHIHAIRPYCSKSVVQIKRGEGVLAMTKMCLCISPSVCVRNNNNTTRKRGVWSGCLFSFSLFPFSPILVLSSSEDETTLI